MNNENASMFVYEQYLLVAEPLFVEDELAGLFVQDVHISVDAGAFRGTGTDVPRQHVTLSDVAPGNVDYQPVMPLAVNQLRTIVVVWIYGVYIGW